MRYLELMNQETNMYGQVWFDIKFSTRQLVSLYDKWSKTSFISNVCDLKSKVNRQKASFPLHGIYLLKCGGPFD